MLERLLLTALAIVIFGSLFAGLVIVANNYILGSVLILLPLGVLFVLTERREDDR